MILYCVELAPNPTKVRLYVAEKRAGGAPLEITERRVKLMKGEQNEPAHRARNPFATLPVLEIADGDYIIESLTIMDYLEAEFPDPSLLGGDHRQVARARELERIAETRVLTPIGRYVHATNSPLGLPPTPAIAEQAARQFDGGLKYFDRRLADARPFIAGDHVTMGDCTLAAALQFARFGGVDPVAEHPNLARWDVDYRARPEVASIFTH